MKLTQIYPTFTDEIDFRKTPPVAFTYDLYMAIVNKFARKGSIECYEAFEKKGTFETYGPKKIHLSYPCTVVKVIGNTLRVEKIIPTDWQDRHEISFYSIK